MCDPVLLCPFFTVKRGQLFLANRMIGLKIEKMFIGPV